MHVFIAIRDSQKLSTCSAIQKRVRNGRRKSIAQVKGWNHRRQLSRRLSIQNLALPKNRLLGLNEKPSGGKSTFTTQCAGMVASVGLSAPLWTGTTMQRGLYFNTAAATGTGVENVSRTIVTKSFATTKHAKTVTKPQ